MLNKPYILVFGATGNIGGKVAEELIRVGAKVSVAGRKPESLNKFAGRAEICTGEFGDDLFLKSVLKHAHAVFLTVPDSVLAEPETGALRLAKALKGSSVKHIVNISNAVIEKSGKLTRLVAFEHELNKIQTVHIKHVRCANFFENLNWGINTPYHPELKLPYISSYEVAHKIASLLLNKDFEGNSVDVLLGPGDYSMKELAAAAGATYTQLGYTSENESFYRPFNEGDFKVEQRTFENTSEQEQRRFTLKYFLENDFKRLTAAQD